MSNRRVISGNAGKYDEVVERLMRDLKADACVLIVRNGRLGGHGMSCAVDPSKPGGVELATGWAMPELLRRMADIGRADDAAPRVHPAGDCGAASGKGRESVMRFRNRFKCEQLSAQVCPDCGLRIAVTLADGRETRIHEFPLCEPFKAWCAVIEALPDGQAHGLSAVLVDDAETLGNPEVIHFDPVQN